MYIIHWFGKLCNTPLCTFCWLLHTNQKGCVKFKFIVNFSSNYFFLSFRTRCIFSSIFYNFVYQVIKIVTFPRGIIMHKLRWYFEKNHFHPHFNFVNPSFFTFYLVTLRFFLYKPKTKSFTISRAFFIMCINYIKTK